MITTSKPKKHKRTRRERKHLYGSAAKRRPERVASSSANIELRGELQTEAIKPEGWRPEDEG